MYIRGGSASEREWLVEYQPIIAQLTRADLSATKPEELGNVATALAGEMTILIPFTDLIDRDAELARLQKEFEHLAAEIERASKKLSNQNFVERAPENIVEKERTRLKEASSDADKLRTQIAQLH